MLGSRVADVPVPVLIVPQAAAPRRAALMADAHLPVQEPNWCFPGEFGTRTESVFPGSDLQEFAEAFCNKHELHDLKVCQLVART